MYKKDGKYLKQYRIYSKLVPQINDSTIPNPRSRFVKFNILLGNRLKTGPAKTSYSFNS